MMQELSKQDWLEKVGPNAKLRDASLSDADLRRANLRYADLRGADLCNANLRRASLCNADLCNADLCNADLCNADLRRADMRDADLRDADLCDADLRDAIGNGREIKSMQASDYCVVWSSTTMAIGCCSHPIAEWWEFSDARIAEMANDALAWWREWKPILRSIIEIKER